MPKKTEAHEMLEKLRKIHTGAAAVMGVDTGIVGWLPTGSTTLDFATRRSLPGGVPAGRVTELFGKPFGGKSVMGQHIMAAAQSLGGTSVLYDHEQAFAKKFSGRIGCNLDDLLVVTPEHAEEMIEMTKTVCSEWKERHPDPEAQPPLVFVWDSIAFTATKYDTENEASRMAELARALSSKFPSVLSAIANQNIYFIAINQVRHQIGGMSQGYTTPGGLTVPHAASLRIRLMPVGQVKVGDTPVGTKVEATIVKNRLAGTRAWKVPLEIGNDGIDDHAGWLDFFVGRKIVTKSGTWHQIQLPGMDKPIRFQRGTWLKKMNEDEAYRKSFADIMFTACQDEENAE